jgi:hypothetical protein
MLLLPGMLLLPFLSLFDCPTADAPLGVREWLRLGRDSGGFDSYTNVSSESEVSASSTALATLASKMSALDVTVPA